MNFSTSNLYLNKQIIFFIDVFFFYLQCINHIYPINNFYFYPKMSIYFNNQINLLITTNRDYSTIDSLYSDFDCWSICCCFLKTVYIWESNLDQVCSLKNVLELDEDRNKLTDVELDIRQTEIVDEIMASFLSILRESYRSTRKHVSSSKKLPLVGQKVSLAPIEVGSRKNWRMPNSDTYIYTSLSLIKCTPLLLRKKFLKNNFFVYVL